MIFKLRALWHAIRMILLGHPGIIIRAHQNLTEIITLHHTGKTR